jgi:hypothetical protein
LGTKGPVVDRPRAPYRALAFAVAVSVMLVATAFLPRQYSTPVTARPLTAEFGEFKRLSLQTVRSACTQARVVVLAPSDVVSVDLAGQLEQLRCTVLRPTVVTPLHTGGADSGVFLVETPLPQGGTPTADDLARTARAQARAVGITTELQPIGRTSTEHFIMSEYTW